MRRGTHAWQPTTLTVKPLSQAVLVTKAFVPQSGTLSVEDIAAMWHCVRELDAIGFYNSGPESGASQPRRHMQLIPMDSLVEAHADLGADLPVRRCARRLACSTAALADTACSPSLHSPSVCRHSSPLTASIATGWWSQGRRSVCLTFASGTLCASMATTCALATSTPQQVSCAAC